jgi:hypothetical protein
MLYGGVCKGQVVACACDNLCLVHMSEECARCINKSASLTAAPMQNCMYIHRICACAIPSCSKGCFD